MTQEAVDGSLFDLFAEVFEYPRPGLPEAAARCEALVASEDQVAARHLAAFRSFAEATSVGRLEEVYTAVFDLNTTCYPYAGYHLFGESYHRSIFLLELKQRYRAHGFIPSGELPDHLSVMLRFLAVCGNPDLRAELIYEALLPMLDKILDEGREADEGQAPPEDVERQPYHEALEALRMVLRRQPAPAEGRVDVEVAASSGLEQFQGGGSDA